MKDLVSCAGQSSSAPGSRLRRLLLLCLLLLAQRYALSLVACHDPDDCSSPMYSECESGKVCVEGRCVATCNTNSDCSSGESCVDGACMPAPDAGAADASADAATADRALSDVFSPDRGAQDALPLDAGAPDTARPDTARPDTALPDTARPDTSAPDAARPDTAQPDSARPDVAQPDTWQPDTAGPDCGTCNPGEECTSDGCLCPALGAACAAGEVCLSAGCCVAGCVVQEACCTIDTRCCPSGTCSGDCDGDGQVSSDLGGTDCDDGCPTCFYGSTSSTSTPDGLDQDCDGEVDDSEAFWVCDPSLRLEHIVEDPGCDDVCADEACAAFCLEAFGVAAVPVDFGGTNGIGCLSTALVDCGGAVWCTALCSRGTGPGSCDVDDPDVDRCQCQIGADAYF